MMSECMLRMKSEISRIVKISFLIAKELLHFLDMLLGSDWPVSFPFHVLEVVMEMQPFLN